MAEIRPMSGLYAAGMGDAQFLMREVSIMKTKVFRILGVIGFILAMGSLSACFDPSYPGYSDPPMSYRAPYAVPEYYPRYYARPVPVPRYYAYNPRANWQNHRRWEHRKHEEDEHHHG
jgi:hypothetical protein